VKAILAVGLRGRRTEFRTKRPSLCLESLEQRLTPAVTFQGGPLIAAPEVMGLFYGAAWSSDPTLEQEANQIRTFLSTIVDSEYMDMLEEYNVGVGTYDGANLDGAAAPAAINDAQVQQAIVSAIQADILPFPNADLVYFVFLPPGTEAAFNNGTSGTEPNTAHFIGYHGVHLEPGNSANIYYVVIPYPGGVNQTVGSLDSFDQITLAASRELVDTATNPLGNGWFDPTLGSSAGQIGDIAGNTYGEVLGYEVQYLWSNDANQPILPEPTNLPDAAQLFTQSTEHYTDLIIDDYRSILGRMPAQSEINGWLAAISRSGLTDEQVMAGFLASNEFYQRAGGTNKAWVDAVYQQVLGRQADPGGESLWLQSLSSGKSLYTVADAITTSTEHENDLVEADYEIFLGRSASSTEIAGWVAALRQGMTQEQVAAAFISSDEAFYYLNASNLNDWLLYAYRTVLDRTPESSELDGWITYLESGL